MSLNLIVTSRWLVSSTEISRMAATEFARILNTTYYKDVAKKGQGNSIDHLNRMGDQYGTKEFSALFSS